MTQQQIIAQAEAIQPALVEQIVQEGWIQDLQLQIWQEVLCACEDAPEKPQPGAPLLIAPPYTDLYVYHLLRQGALVAGDTEQYNQYLLLFSSRYREFAAWYLRNHKPKGA